MSKNFVLIILLVNLFDASLCCIIYPPPYESQSLPNSASIASPPINYITFNSYGKDCGHNKYGNSMQLDSIVAGVETYENEFPFMVTLQNGRDFCAGVIVSP